MPHRGRLSVLRNYLGKDLQRLFTEFEDSWSEGSNQGGGDVKYHRGYSGDQALTGSAAGKSVHLSMLNNPSHLESVNPVVMGRCRARQDASGDTERRKIISVLLHGDAAMMGQGVVAECLNMSQLDGYNVGGTLHIIVNNQVGFTTDPSDARSTTYCTDVAKIIGAPVLHVNADDPEAVVACAMLAMEYRHEFRKDVFIDLVCFRRYGHNEQDEPNYTQPGLYALVRAHPGTAEVYRRKLIAGGVVTESQAQVMADAVTSELDAAQSLAKSSPVNPVPPPGGGQWTGMIGAYSFESPKTAVDAKTISEICAAMGHAPDGFHVHPKLRGLLQARAGLPTTKKLSHADAEQIAVGSLVLEGYPVRLSGQDCRRGTFTQRHAVLRDEKTDARYTSLNHIREQQSAKFEVWDSPLSEYAVMGFDYGYSRAWPKTLVMWEGQFGDFVNGAQIMIDQFLASSETKWNRWAGLTLLLPHGHEGQGPEHSSARLERFLQLCADDNMEVAYPSTGGQLFHILRRQALRNFRKPLILMTPKKFLRVETSIIDELSTGVFQHLIDDNTVTSSAAKNVSTILYCSGKLYHELHERRLATQRADVAIVRVEQLYPFHTKLAREIDARYPKGAARVWVQEEPRNQGAFLHMLDVFNHQVGVELGYIGRAPSASPATGSEHVHKGQQEDILTRAIGPLAKTTTDSHVGSAASTAATSEAKGSVPVVKH
jgi:2-oxoglutarate dehydrogenase E1 component